jgi:hypothetical protein
VVWGDADRARLLAEHEVKLAQHPRAVEKFNRRRDELLVEQERLNQERDALRRAETILRPTPKDVVV